MSPVQLSLATCGGPGRRDICEGTAEEAAPQLSRNFGSRKRGVVAEFKRVSSSGMFEGTEEAALQQGKEPLWRA